jgi:hypothetical protein
MHRTVGGLVAGILFVIPGIVSIIHRWSSEPGVGVAYSKIFQRLKPDLRNRLHRKSEDLCRFRRECRPFP